ncbi:MAG: CcmD family protein [Bacteroidetes bacterium]|nr:MAG: CcmD family protein [Bacteroidota bacterium]
MDRRLSRFLILLFSQWPIFAFSQVTDAERKYTAFDMRSNGKIYVVVTVVLIILIGLLLYLIRLDRKITRLEKEAGDHEKHS